MILVSDSPHQESSGYKAQWLTSGHFYKKTKSCISRNCQRKGNDAGKVHEKMSSSVGSLGFLLLLSSETLTIHWSEIFQDGLVNMSKSQGQKFFFKKKRFKYLPSEFVWALLLLCSQAWWKDLTVPLTCVFSEWAMKKERWTQSRKVSLRWKLQNQAATIFSNTFISIFHHTQEKERYNSDHAIQHIEWRQFVSPIFN